MSDWDADDFEVDVKQIEEKKVNVVEEVSEKKAAETVPKVAKPQAPKVETKAINAFKSFSNELDRELTESEKIRMQMESDLSFARELFGAEEEADLAGLTSLADYKRFGEEIGEKLTTRTNGIYYVDMLIALLRTATASMEASKLRILSNQLKAMADERSTKEKEEKKPKGKGASAKPTLKGVQKSNKINIEDYGDYPIEDDLEDDFM